MQSKPEYQHAIVVVDLAEKHGGDAPDFLVVNEDVPTDGVVDLRYPRETPPPDGWDETHGEFWRHSIPFRDHRKDGPWFGWPENDQWHRQPVWKWQNPDEPTENITLNPSYGMRDTENDRWEIHCYIRNGEVDLL